MRFRIDVQGVVQGVGFRPFVYRAARTSGVHGFVLNSSGSVIIEAEGRESSLDHFLHLLRKNPPPLARIDTLTVLELEPRGESAFVIRHSAPAASSLTLIPPDAATCVDCLRECTTPTDRRYGYPFTNCTHCGPRYSIIRDVPYDRARTTMEPFAMCPRCQTEYEDPSDRRFHAEPNACPDCGPSLLLLSRDEFESGTPPVFAPAHHSRAIVQRVQQLLRAGEIVAIKGLGGFHLACDAANHEAVARLRASKRRGDKPFAVMARDLSTAARLCEVPSAARRLLVNARRPIVLLRRRTGAGVASNVAPRAATLGVLLPYTPLHHLLFAEPAAFDALVMTSGNMSEEPIVSRNQEAWPRLRSLANHFLLHNRDIQTAVDDSVVQVFEGRAYPVRRSRGFAPEPIDLHMPLRQILACGGAGKNTLCLTKEHFAILSQHLGDLENLETLQFFRETLVHLQRFFRVSPEAVAHDLHPHYLSTRFALHESGLPAIAVQHHHAHIASCMADNGIQGPVVGVAFDGTGYGTDGAIWGGEFLVCDFAGFERRGHLRYVPLPGGDAAVRQPWRSALAYLHDACGPAASSLPLPLFTAIPPRQVALVERMLTRGIQTVPTSSCGRLFDAVAAILGLRYESTYEGQAAIELETAASGTAESYPFQLTEADPFEIDLRPLIQSLVRDLLAGASTAILAARFHRTLAQVVVDACVRMRAAGDPNRVCLSGGSFQNLRLLEASVTGLRQCGFEVFVHRRVPPNDGGLSLGQAVIANALLEKQARRAPLTHSPPK